MDSPSPVKDSRPGRPLADPGPFLDRIQQAARRAGWRSERFGEAAGFPLVALTRRSPGPRPRIYLSAGIHGDEPAGPLAILGLLESGALDGRATWFLCPILNPGGFVRGTRENPSGIDLNRDYRNPRSPEIRSHLAWLGRQPGFDLTLCLHEDWESKGCYVYERNPSGRPSLAGRILEAASPFCPRDTDPVIDGWEAEQGVIRPPGDPFGRELWPETIFLSSGHTKLAYTFETPSGLPIDRRIEAHRAAANAAFLGMF
jgi:hypothetical protein